MNKSSKSRNQSQKSLFEIKRRIEATELVQKSNKLLLKLCKKEGGC